MKIAIMQPYFFPYIGYFQLINAVDKFVFLDDVNFINRGWINRNRILVNGKDVIFTIPLKDASQNRLINEIMTGGDEWKNKILKTIELSYKKAPQFYSVFGVINEVISSSLHDIASFAKKSIESVCSYLEIKTEIVFSSNQYNNKNLKGEERIIDIVLKEKATDYINPGGGTELYNRDNFFDRGLQLYFLKTKELIYPQFKNQFVPFLSIVDVMMFNEKEKVKQLLQEYELV